MSIFSWFSWNNLENHLVVLFVNEARVDDRVFVSFPSLLTFKFFESNEIKSIQSYGKIILCEIDFLTESKLTTSNHLCIKSLVLLETLIK